MSISYRILAVILSLSLAVPANGEEDYSEAIIKATVLLQEKGTMRGTGVILKETQDKDTCFLQVLTARHLAEATKALEMPHSGYVEHSRKLHTTHDLALVTLKKKEACTLNNLQVAKTSQEPLRAGFRIWTVGYPRGDHFVGSGVIGEPYTSQKKDWEGVIFTYVLSFSGSSGSPIIYKDRVVAILVGARTYSDEDFSFNSVSLPIKYANELLN